jgi:hypothetical protein
MVFGEHCALRLNWCEPKKPERRFHAIPFDLLVPDVLSQLAAKFYLGQVIGERPDHAKTLFEGVFGGELYVVD